MREHLVPVSELAEQLGDFSPSVELVDQFPKKQSALLYRSPIRDCLSVSFKKD